MKRLFAMLMPQFSKIPAFCAIIFRSWHRGIPIKTSFGRTRTSFVLGTPDYPEDWLIPKLLDDGAELQFKGELRSSYKDKWFLK